MCTQFWASAKKANFYSTAQQEGGKKDFATSDFPCQQRQQSEEKGTESSEPHFQKYKPFRTSLESAPVQFLVLAPGLISSQIVPSPSVPSLGSKSNGHQQPSLSSSITLDLDTNKSRPSHTAPTRTLPPPTLLQLSTPATATKTKSSTVHPLEVLPKINIGRIKYRVGSRTLAQDQKETSDAIVSRPSAAFKFATFKFATTHASPRVDTYTPRRNPTLCED